jgi:hypothetical protein
MIDILVIILPMVTVGAIVWFFTRRGFSRKSKVTKTDHRTRQERAVWAWTKVLSARIGPPNTFGLARVELDLEVHLPGNDVYQESTTWLVEKEALGYVQVGEEVPVKIDPAEPRYVYPNGRWAKYAG